MNTDKKELIETGAVILLVLVFAACCMLCVKWGVPYQTLIVFAGFIGTLLGVLGMKMRATGSGTNGQPASPNGQPPNPS